MRPLLIPQCSGVGLALFVCMFFQLASLGAQELVDVSGVVSDATGTLPGATVQVQGSTVGTQTDFEGRYALQGVASDATLLVSYLGYALQEVPLNGRTTVDIQMEENAQALDEVVVVGYGTVKKTDLTGSVASISGDDLAQVPAASVTELLAGRLSGVTVTNTNGAPGSAPQILVRGVRSPNAGNAPLIIVNGTIFNGDITQINPADIESINVLKDAASTAVYGYRGANGVIVITTKRGSARRLNVFFNTTFGLLEPQGGIDLMNAQEFVDYTREAFRNSGNYNGPEDDEGILFPEPFRNFQEGVDVDWYETTVGQHQATQQNNYLSISGGSDDTQVRLSLGYFDQEYIFPGSTFERYSFNGALDHQTANDKFEFGGDILFAYSDREIGPNPFTFLFRQSPLLDPFDSTGQIQAIPLGDDPFQLSPLVNYLPGVRQVDNFQANTRVTAYAQYNITPELNVRVNANTTFDAGFFGQFFGSRSIERFGVGTPLTRTENQFNNYYTVNTVVNYTKQFGLHSLNLQGVGEAYQQTNRNQFNQGENGFDGLIYNNQQFALQNILIGSEQNINGLQQTASGFLKTSSLSLLGRFEYNYDNRYYLTGSLRYDGASQLAEGNKYALFPTISGRWRISEEDFIDTGGAIDALSIRASIGQAGNQSVRAYGTIGTLGTAATAFGTGVQGNTQLTLFPLTINSPDLGWEISTSINLGLEASFFDYRLTFDVDLYQTNTQDLIFRRQLPSTSGFATTDILQNVGKTRVNGIDLSIGGDVIRTANFTWTLDGVFTHYRDEIVSLYNDLDTLNNQLFVGQPYQGLIFDFEKVGIWQLGEEDQFGEITNFDLAAGDVRVVDRNGDGLLNDADRTIVGYNVAKTRVGLRSTIRFKGLDLTAQFDGGFGAEDYDLVRSFHDEQTGRFGRARLDYWTPENPTNAYPRPVQGGGDAMPFANTSFFVPMDWVKLREITLGYNLPKTVLGWQNVVRDVRLTVSGSNILVWSNYDWAFDPEASGTVLNPPTTSVIFGLRVNF